MMAAIRIVVGIVFIVAGSIAIADGNLVEQSWWLFSVAIGVIGILALASALRR